MQNNRSISLSSLWYCPKFPSKLENPIIKFTCDIVKKIHSNLGTSGISLPSCPLWNNPLLSIGGNPLSDIAWQNLNIHRLSQVLRDGSMLPLTTLKANFGLSGSSFLTDLQFKANLNRLSTQGSSISCHKELDEKLEAIAHGVVSKLYRLLSFSFPNCNTSNQLQWQQDLGINLSSSEWDGLWRNSINTSKCVRYRVIQMKIMHRAYLTPVRLKKMDQSLSAHCWYGCGEEGTLLHMLWHCPVIESLWREVALFLSGILKVDLQLSPKTCLLGARVENIQSNKHQRVVALACLSTKRMILMNWKVRKPSCFSRDRWLEEFLFLLSMERATSILEELDEDTSELWVSIRFFLGVQEYRCLIFFSAVCSRLLYPEHQNPIQLSLRSEENVNRCSH